MLAQNLNTPISNESRTQNDFDSSGPWVHNNQFWSKEENYSLEVFKIAKFVMVLLRRDFKRTYVMVG